MLYDHVHVGLQSLQSLKCIHTRWWNECQGTICHTLANFWVIKENVLFYKALLVYQTFATKYF